MSKIDVRVSGDLYFLVDVTNPTNPQFSSVFVRNNIEPIQLQLLRDIDWSFKLSKKEKIHKLYKYFTNENKHPIYHKYDIINKYKKNNQQFTIIGEYIIDDKNPCFHKLQNIITMIKDEHKNNHQESINEFLSREVVNINIHYLNKLIKIEYRADIYRDQFNIETLLSLPKIKIY